MADVVHGLPGRVLDPFDDLDTFLGTFFFRRCQRDPGEENTIMFVPSTPFGGKVVIDAQPVQNALYNIAPGSRRKLKRLRKNVAEAIAELRVALPVYCALLGLTGAEIVQRLDSLAQNVEGLRELREDVARLHEAIEQSLALHEDALEAEIATVATTVKRAGRRKIPAILAPFEKTLAYHGSSAQKGVATRRKNQAEGTGKRGKGKAKKRDEAAGTPGFPSVER